MVDRKFRMRAVMAALLGLAVAAVQAAPAQAAPAPAAPAAAGASFTLPEGAPTPGAGFAIKRAYRVIYGVQIYSCVTNADGTTAWSTPTSVPEAVLKAYGSWRLIYHFEGPSWRALDGSTIGAAVTTRVPKDGTIPWLLLTVSRHENDKPGGELTNVTHVSRVNTTGGVGPTGTCETGAKKRVSYTADYVFWAPTAA